MEFSQFDIIKNFYNKILLCDIKIPCNGVLTIRECFSENLDFTSTLQNNQYTYVTKLPMTNKGTVILCTLNDRERSNRGNEFSAELTGRMNGLKHVCMLILSINLSTTVSQYVDDSDYEDYGVYDEFLPNDHRAIRQPKQQVDTTQNDFYLINDNEEAMPKNDINKNNIYTAKEQIDLVQENDEESVEVINPPYQQLKWLKSPERVYQYTKHRIPGYDYHELDFMGDKKVNKCDTRSVWSHCVCQFTCSNPNEVDCYMPCISGCECKEAYVFDEKTQLCVPLEMCEKQENINIYEK